jgi:hypothetical protein
MERIEVGKFILGLLCAALANRLPTDPALPAEIARQAQTKDCHNRFTVIFKSSLQGFEQTTNFYRSQGH